MTPSERVRAAYTAALQAKLAADIAAAEYDYVRAVALRDVGAPSGWSFDLFGDGELKPMQECARVCPLKERDADA